MGNTCAGFQYFNGYWNEFHSGTKDGFWFSKNNLFSGLNPIFSKPNRLNSFFICGVLK